MHGTRRRWGLIIAALCASLMFGGLVAVSTPAGAQLATNWGKIWKTKLQPKADKRYYKKTVANKKFAANPKLIRGTFAVSDTGTATASPLLGSISFGYQLTAAPTVHYVAMGAPTPAGCSGDAANPGAAKGHLCVFEAAAVNATSNGVCMPTGTGGSGTTGAIVAATSDAAGVAYLSGTWAVKPAGIKGTFTPSPTPRKPVMGSFGRRPLARSRVEVATLDP